MQPFSEFNPHTTYPALSCSLFVSTRRTASHHTPRPVTYVNCWAPLSVEVELNSRQDTKK
jgi:hypothetical protein